MVDQVPAGPERIGLVTADITTLQVDAFVYYARPDLGLGSGFGTAISVRGGPSVQQELKSLGPVAVGEAVVTAAGGLKAHHIIHAVGPRFQEDRTEEKLRATVRRVLQLATEKGFAHIALPAMGVGFYGVPLGLSAAVMVSEIRTYLAGAATPERVTISVIDSREYKALAAQLAAAGAGSPVGGRP
jgi:O-acetyl-ADP-ribose deacetylase (regulator of RNase III)